MRLAALACAATIGLGIGLPLPAAQAAEGDTLYVNNAATANCSDAGTGTAVQPYCSIQPAVDAAQPGQTVEVAYGGKYPEQVTLSRSGTADKPITIIGGSLRIGSLRTLTVMPSISPVTTGSPALSGTDVHDVKVSGFKFASAAEAVLLTDTQRITIDGNYIEGGSAAATAAGIRVTGAATDTRLTRNILDLDRPQAISVEAGVRGTVLTNNAVSQKGNGGGIAVTDAPGTVITGNTVSAPCKPSLALLGDSSAAVVENNVLAVSTYGTTLRTCPAPTAKVQVSAASRADTTIDYNLFSTFVSGGAAYDWAGSPADNLTDFGQGAHDLIRDVSLGRPQQGLANANSTYGVDAGDATAPGAADGDLFGFQPIDDPAVVNSGTALRDRGATEITTATRQINLSPNLTALPIGESVTVSVRDILPTWSPVVSYDIAFGDGSAPVTTTGTSVRHIYTVPGSYTLVYTVTTQNGDVFRKATGQVVVGTPGPLVADFTAAPQDVPLQYQFDTVGTVSPWMITKRTLEFGDGSGLTVGGSAVPPFSHLYRADGVYTVTLTVIDAGGRTEKVSQQVHVAYRTGGFYPLTPTRLLDTRRPPGESLGNTLWPGSSLDFSVYNSPVSPEHTPTAVVLNVAVISYTQGGYITLYPFGGLRPATSNVNYAADRTVANLVTVPVSTEGKIAVANELGFGEMVVDIVGYYSSDKGDRYTAQTPVRLADTRASKNAPGPGGQISVQVAGQHGVPAGATAAVLNVTATRPTQPGFLTVYPAGISRPGTSNLNFAAGQTVSNQVVVPIGADGKVNVYNRFGSTDVVVDLFGYYSPDGEALFTPVTPKRVADTRTGTGAPVGPGATLRVPSGAPAGATGAVLNVTSTGSPTGGFLTVWADGQQRPGTSNVNFIAGQTVPNHVTTPLGTNGMFDVYNSNGNTHVVADVFGYFTKPQT